MATFRIPRTNVVESDEGYSVEVLGRTGIEYREAERVMFVDSEILSAGYGIAIFTKSIERWNPPFEKEMITEEKRKIIVDNIRRAIEFRQQPVDIVW